MGSHTCNLIGSLPDDVRRYERVPRYVVQPAVEAGDVVILTDALIHAALPWAADHERVALLCKYSPEHAF